MWNPTDRATANTPPASVCCAAPSRTSGSRFADYVVVDGEFATAPFLHTTEELRLKVVARLKDNLPELRAAAQKRFQSQPPSLSF